MGLIGPDAQSIAQKGETIGQTTRNVPMGVELPPNFKGMLDVTYAIKGSAPSATITINNYLKEDTRRTLVGGYTFVIKATE